jgi:hypothetical protein
MYRPGLETSLRCSSCFGERKANRLTDYIHIEWQKLSLHKFVDDTATAVRK